MYVIIFLLAACALHAEFRAGVAKTVITPDLEKHGPVYMAGFGNNRVATGVHDDLYSRCVALSASSRPLVVCEVDLIGLFLDDTARIRTAIRAKSPDADVVVASTHVHEGPDTMGMWGPSNGVSGINDAYADFVVARVTESALAAIAGMKPARARFASVKNPELDTFISDNRPPDTHDSDLILLSLTDNAGKPLATIVNWANHPETLGSKNTLITADYPYYVLAELEKRTGGTAILWNGAVGGMQSTLGAKVKDPETGADLKEATFRKAELIGTRVGDLAADALGKAVAAKVDSIEYSETPLRIPMTNQGFQLAAKAGIFKGRKMPNDDGTSNSIAGLIRLKAAGKPVLEVALIPGEMYPELSTGAVERYSGADFPDAPIEPAVKPGMTAPYRMLIGLANDEVGYIIPKAEWDEKPPFLNGSPKRYYGEVNSLGPDAAPIIAEAVRKLLASGK